MKKIIIFFVFALVLISTTDSIYAIDIIFHVKRPPFNELKSSDLWGATIVNNGNAFSAYLYGTLTNNETGELIATGQTVSFEVKKGTTNFKISDLPSIPDINYISKDPKFKQSFMNTGGAPPGNYKVCVELRYTNNTVAGDDCFEQKIIGSDAPQLISPKDEEELKISNPVFTWMHLKAPGSELSYTLKIVELKGDESPENAMLKNKAFFEKEGITQQMFQYPSSAPKFEEGKTYAWQINIADIKSNIGVFSVTSGVHLEITVDSLKCTGKNGQYTFKIVATNLSSNSFPSQIIAPVSATPSGTIVVTSPTLPVNVPIGASQIITGTITYTGTISTPPDFDVIFKKISNSYIYHVNGMAAGVFNNCCTAPPPNMLAWWAFDETSGTTAFDMAGFNNVGTQVGTPAFVTGKVAGALKFTGTNYVTAANHPDLNFGPCDDFSMDAWVKTNGTGIQCIADKRENGSCVSLGYSFFLYNGKVAFQMGNGSSFGNYTANSSAPLVNDDKWHLVAMTYRRTGSVLTFYEDGVAVTTFSGITVGNLINSADLFIGQRQTSFGNVSFNGIIDELEIFKRELSSSEILAIYNADSAGKCKK